VQGAVRKLSGSNPVSGEKRIRIGQANLLGHSGARMTLQLFPKLGPEGSALMHPTPALMSHRVGNPRKQA